MTAVKVESWWAASLLRFWPYQDFRSAPLAMATIGNQAKTHFHICSMPPGLE
jgi:hypothetical protein